MSIISALHSKYIYTNNGDTISVTNNGILKIFLGHLNTKAPMVLLIYLAYNFVCWHGESLSSTKTKSSDNIEIICFT